MNISSNNVYACNNCYDRRAQHSPDGRRKIQLFAAMIPAGCQSVLDAGGGTGWTTIGIQKKCHVVTLDSSAASLNHVKGDKILGDIRELPFSNQSFDLVISSEVLEHLSDQDLGRACTEIMRVARKYILVSVPYRELLEARLVRCENCGHVFHRDHHCRAFSEQDLAGLFPGWVLAEWHVFGALSTGVGVSKLRSAPPPTRGRFIPPADEYSICAACGKQGNKAASPSITTTRSPFRRILSFLQHLIDRMVTWRPGRLNVTFLPQSVTPYWIAGLYILKDSELAVEGDISEYVNVQETNQFQK